MKPECNKNSTRDIALQAIKDIHSAIWKVAEFSVENSSKPVKRQISIAKWSHLGMLTPVIHVAKELSEGKALSVALECCIPELGKEVVKEVADILTTKAALKILPKMGARFFSAFLGEILFSDPAGERPEDLIKFLNKSKNLRNLDSRIHPISIQVSKHLNQAKKNIKHKDDHYMSKTNSNINPLKKHEPRSDWDIDLQKKYSNLQQNYQEIYDSQYSSHEKVNQIMGCVKELQQEMGIQRLERESKHEKSSCLIIFKVSAMDLISLPVLVMKQAAKGYSVLVRQGLP